MKYKHTSSETRDRLMEAGLKEFYKYGYLHASLRRICDNCGVTTGAFYFSFTSKEELFRAILEPVLRKWQALSDQLVEEELEDPSVGRDNDRRIMEFEYQHRKEWLILLEKSEGSCYEGFRRHLTSTLSQYFERFFIQSLGHEARPEIIRLLVELRLQGNIDLLKGDHELDELLFLYDVLSCYAEGGFFYLAEHMRDRL